MWIRKLLDSLKPRRSDRLAPGNRPAARSRLAVETLEDRSVPAALSIGDATVLEGVSGTRNAAVVVTLSAASSKTVTVNYLTSGGSATPGGDYDPVSGTLTFARGETSKTILVPVRGDLVAEGDEQFEVWLYGASKGTTYADSRATVTIQDRAPHLTVSDESVYQSGFMTFTVTLSAAQGQPFTVNFATGDGSARAGEDYVATSGTQTFAPGETTKTITVEVLEDQGEYDEWFYVHLSGVTADVATGYGVGTIYSGNGSEW